VYRLSISRGGVAVIDAGSAYWKLTVARVASFSILYVSPCSSRAAYRPSASLLLHADEYHGPRSRRSARSALPLKAPQRNQACAEDREEVCPCHPQYPEVAEARTRRAARANSGGAELPEDPPPVRRRRLSWLTAWAASSSAVVDNRSAIAAFCCRPSPVGPPPGPFCSPSSARAGRGDLLNELRGLLYSGSMAASSTPARSATSTLDEESCPISPAAFWSFPRACGPPRQPRQLCRVPFARFYRALSARRFVCRASL
jgi:hypothetical protein